MDERHQIEVVGKPSQYALDMMYDMIVDWMMAGCPVQICPDCGRPLKTEAELKAERCAWHIEHPRKETKPRKPRKATVKQ